MIIDVWRSDLGSRLELEAIKRGIQTIYASVCQHDSLEGSDLASQVCARTPASVERSRVVVQEFTAKLHEFLNRHLSPAGWNVVVTGRSGFFLRYRKASLMVARVKTESTHTSATIIIYRSPSSVVPVSFRTLQAENRLAESKGNVAGNSVADVPALFSSITVESVEVIRLAANATKASEARDSSCPKEILAWGFLDLSPTEKRQIVSVAFQRANRLYSARKDKEDIQILAQWIALELLVVAGPMWTVIVTQDPILEFKTTYPPIAVVRSCWHHQSSQTTYSVLAYQLCGKPTVFSLSLRQFISVLPYGLLVLVCGIWLLKPRLCKRLATQSNAFARHLASGLCGSSATGMDPMTTLLTCTLLMFALAKAGKRLMSR